MKYLKNKNLMIQFFPLLLVCYEIINYLANDMYLPALPSMIHNLGISTRLAQQTITAWFFGASSLHLLLGPVSDRFGRKPVLLIGGILFITATWICAITSNIHIFKRVAMLTKNFGRHAPEICSHHATIIRPRPSCVRRALIPNGIHARVSHNDLTA